MDLTPYLARLQRDLLTAARAGGPDAVDLAEVLAAGIEPAVRVLVQDAVVEAAAEVTARLSPGSVDVRVRGQELDLVVTAPESLAPMAAAQPAPADPPTDPEDDEAGGTARLSLRLPERLKPRVEEAADAAGVSVNAWLVRTVSAALTSTTATAAAPTVVTTHTGQRRTGWVR